jgi:RHH-type transcriptional regulator, rel operon repressor / antitoxin RelB
MKDTTMTVRMSQETKNRLIQLAEATNRTKSYLIDHAISDYLNTHEWQVLETKKALEYAESPNAEWLDHQSIKSMWTEKLED